MASTDMQRKTRSCSMEEPPAPTTTTAVSPTFSHRLVALTVLDGFSRFALVLSNRVDLFFLSDAGSVTNTLSESRIFLTLAPRIKHSRAFQKLLPPAPVRVHCFMTTFIARSVRITTPFTVSPFRSSTEISFPLQLRRMSIGVIGRRVALMTAKCSLRLNYDEIYRCREGERHRLRSVGNALEGSHEFGNARACMARCLFF